MDIVQGVQIVGVVLVFALVALAFILIKAYNVQCYIYEEGQLGSMKMTTRKAKRSQELSGTVMKFLFSKEEMPQPPGDYFFLTGKNTYAINLIRPKNGNLYPVKFRIDTDNKLHLVPDDRDMRAWLVNRMQKANAAYNKPSGWAVIAPVVMVGGAFAFAIAVIVISGHYYTQTMQALSGQVGGQLSELTQALHTVGGTTPPPVP